MEGVEIDDGNGSKWPEWAEFKPKSFCLHSVLAKWPKRKILAIPSENETELTTMFWSYNSGNALFHILWGFNHGSREWKNHGPLVIVCSFQRRGLESCPQWCCGPWLVHSGSPWVKTLGKSPFLCYIIGVETSFYLGFEKKTKPLALPAMEDQGMRCQDPWRAKAVLKVQQKRVSIFYFIFLYILPVYHLVLSVN